MDLNEPNQQQQQQKKLIHKCNNTETNFKYRNIFDIFA